MTTTENAAKSKPSRTKLNLWVDIVTGLAFAFMVGSGILAKWILPPGSRGGTGFVWLGQGRHFWSDIHFWVGISMLALVILHIYLHWNWVVGTWGRLVGRLGSPVTLALLVPMIVFMVLPLVIPRQFSEEYLAEHEAQEEAASQHLEQYLEDEQSLTTGNGPGDLEPGVSDPAPAGNQ
jgi:hypothetical protein